MNDRERLQIAYQTHIANGVARYESAKADAAARNKNADAVWALIKGLQVARSSAPGLLPGLTDEAIDTESARLAARYGV